MAIKYAVGGPPITTNSRFLKTPDSVRTGIQKSNFEKKGKGGDMAKLSGETKVERAIKPKT